MSLVLKQTKVINNISFFVRLSNLAYEERFRSLPKRQFEKKTAQRFVFINIFALFANESKINGTNYLMSPVHSTIDKEWLTT